MRKILLFILLIVPVYVYADSINISCPSEVEKNTEFSCEITGTTSTEVTDADMKLKLTNLSFVTFVKASNWNGEGDEESIGLYGSGTFKGTFKIGTLKVKSGTSTGTISLSNIMFYSDNGNNSVNAVSKSVSIKSVPSNTPSINSSKPSSSNSNTGSSSKTSSKSSSSSNDSRDDDIAKEKEKYNFEDETEYSNKAFLSNIKIDNYIIDFRKDIFNYNLEIGNETKLTIIPIVDNNNITYEIHGNENLKNGSQIYIETNYLDQDMQTYYINIIKKENKFNFVPIFITLIALLVIVNIVRLIIGRRKYDE